MKVQKLGVTVGSFHEERGVTTRTTQRLNTYVTNHVCEGCNHGWMSGLEIWFVESLGNLIEPNRACFVQEAIALAYLKTPTLGSWLLKTAITAEQNSTMKNRVIPHWMRSFPMRELHLDSLWLDIGFIHNADVSMRLMKGAPVWNGDEFHAYQEHKDGFSFSLQLNHLLLRILHAPAAYVRRLSASEGEAMSSMSPLAPREFNSMDQFNQSLYLRTWEGKR